MFNPTLLIALVFASFHLSGAAPTSSHHDIDVVSSVVKHDSSSSSSSTAFTKSPTSISISESKDNPTSTSSSSSTSTFQMAYETVKPASDALNYPMYEQNADIVPQAINALGLGSSILGPQNLQVERQNPDLMAPPSTDSGSTPNVKWSFALSPMRLQTGGWARGQNVNNMPVSDAMASVNMKLEAGAVRELHWHTTSEWAYILKGGVRVTAMNTDGQVFMDTVNEGDLWYFPPGIPHSLQATDDDPSGSEFLLVFDSGEFTEYDTFQLTDWTAHVPKEVLAKNFQVNASAFDNIPAGELYIFPNTIPTPGATPPTGPAGTIPTPFTYHFSQVNATACPGGSAKIVDTRTFPIASTIVGALMTVEPGAMRELHWHPTQSEWSYFLEGTARMTLFASGGNAQTFDYSPGDVGYVPPTFGHYVENTGNTTMRFLEIFNSDLVQDISLNQWLALTPPEIVQAHLGVSNDTISKLLKTKPIII